MTGASSTSPAGILVMAYGTPRSLADVESYYTDIRHGRAPEPTALEELIGRYRAIGGVSPLLEITTAQAEGLEERLGIRAYVGLKHADPFISDAVTALAKDGVELVVGFVLAPHFSNMSIGDYRRRTQRAAEDIGWAGELRMVESWHLEPGYIDWLGSRAIRAVAEVGGTVDDTVVLFTAHSLPEKILDSGDPYADQLTATARGVAEVTGMMRWRTAWQSAGRTDARWLGPDVLEVITDLAAAGEKRVVVCPCGFVADHLEVLYDLDIEAKSLAEELGLRFARTEAPNDDPAFLDAIAGVVKRALTG